MWLAAGQQLAKVPRCLGSIPQVAAVHRAGLKRPTGPFGRRSPKTTKSSERLDGGCRGRVVHLGSCGTVDVHGRELKKFLGRTGALAVCGFREDVDWLESAAFDMLVLGRLQGASFLRTSRHAEV